jgi:hypothetical protein
LLARHHHDLDLPVLEKFLEHPNKSISMGAIRALYEYHRFAETVRDREDALADWGWDGITEAERHLCAIEELDHAIQENGFTGYYYSAGGNRWQIAQAALKAVGATERLRLMESTFASFPDSTPQVNRGVRGNYLEDIVRTKKDPFISQDDDWYKSSEDLDLLMFHYDLAHREGRERKK